ncbi:hypothetical protein LWI29_028279 [Acer saccharum]|uniref:Uncharacterized protein n=1 Tax=Acer saccharum TaxID=4024 RepID=A0AA39W2M6_ACESA|nr:hypothetical protein LWI29_028279 [Acer saccharum]
MISSEIFTRLHARLPRLCDFDTVCDLQARAVKNSEAASKRHAAGLAKDGIASPDGDDHSDGGEEAGDASRGGALSRSPRRRHSSFQENNSLYLKLEGCDRAQVATLATLDSHPVEYITA